MARKVQVHQLQHVQDGAAAAAARVDVGGFAADRARENAQCDRADAHVLSYPTELCPSGQTIQNNVWTETRWRKRPFPTPRDQRRLLSAGARRIRGSLQACRYTQFTNSLGIHNMHNTSTGMTVWISGRFEPHWRVPKMKCPVSRLDQPHRVLQPFSKESSHPIRRATCAAVRQARKKRLHALAVIRIPARECRAQQHLPAAAPLHCETVCGVIVRRLKCAQSLACRVRAEEAPAEAVLSITSSGVRCQGRTACASKWERADRKLEAEEPIRPRKVSVAGAAAAEPSADHWEIRSLVKGRHGAAHRGPNL